MQLIRQVQHIRTVLNTYVDITTSAANT